MLNNWENLNPHDNKWFQIYVLEMQIQMQIFVISYETNTESANFCDVNTSKVRITEIWCICHIGCRCTCRCIIWENDPGIVNLF